MTQRIPHTWRSRTTSVVAAGGALALLAGCGSSGTSDGSSSGADAKAATSFTLVAPSSGEGDSAEQLIVKAYEKATGVHIKVDMEPADSYDQTVRTELQAGTAADVIGVTPGQLFPTSVGPLAKAGMIAPITNGSVAQTLTKGTEALFTYDGKVYAQPTGTVVFGLIANDATVASGGDFPASFEDMLASCKQTGGKPAFMAIAGSVPASTSVLAAELAANLVYAEDPSWNQERTQGKVTFAGSDGWRQVFEAVGQMNAAGCFQAGAAGAGFDALIQGLMSGQAATIPLPSLAVAEMQRVNASAKVSVHGFPAPNGSSPELIAGPSFGFSINAHAGAGTKAAAEAFLDWLAKPENAATYAGYEGSIPAASLGDASKIPAAYQSVAQQLTSGHYTYLPSDDWTNPQVYNAMGTGLQALLTKQGSVDSALKSMDQAWDSGN